MDYKYYSWQNNLSLWLSSIDEIAKNLPPSGAELILFNVGSLETFEALHHLRPDVVQIKGDFGSQPDNSVDAIVAHSVYYQLDEPRGFLADCQRILRSGGRMILIDPSDEYPPRAALGMVTSNFVTARSLYQWHRTALRRFSPETIAEELIEAGFVRILSESIMKGWGILSRGEKPHVEEASTLERIAIGATGKNQLGLFRGQQCLDIQGRYIHLLIKQTPNKPVWNLGDEPLRWEGITVHTPLDGNALVGFTSLPKAVAFMQAAILAGTIRDINKVGKFGKETIAAWDFPILLNPTVDILNAEYPLASLMEIDPTSAEKADE